MSEGAFVRTVLGDIDRPPGLTWLLDGFSAAMEERGLDPDARRQLFVENPSRVFSFATVERGSA